MGAWGEKGYDNDSACDWLGGLSDSLRFTLDHGFWSRWPEEGIAAAQLLTELPPVIQDRLGVFAFNEALAVVDQELKPASTKPWKSPHKRKSYLMGLRRKLSLRQKTLARQHARMMKNRAKIKVVFKKGTEKQ